MPFVVKIVIYWMKNQFEPVYNPIIVSRKNVMDEMQLESHKSFPPLLIIVTFQQKDAIIKVKLVIYLNKNQYKLFYRYRI